MPSRYHESTKLGSRRTVCFELGSCLRVRAEDRPGPFPCYNAAAAASGASRTGLCEFRQGAIEIKLVREGDAEIQMCVRRLGIQLDDSAKIRDGFASLIQTGEDHGPRGERLGVVRFKAQGALKSLARFRESRLAGQDEAEIHKFLGVLRIVSRPLAGTIAPLQWTCPCSPYRTPRLFCASAYCRSSHIAFLNCISASSICLA